MDEYNKENRRPLRLGDFDRFLGKVEAAQQRGDEYPIEQYLEEENARLPKPDGFVCVPYVPAEDTDQTKFSVPDGVVDLRSMLAEFREANDECRQSLVDFAGDYFDRIVTVCRYGRAAFAFWDMEGPIGKRRHGGDLVAAMKESAKLLELGVDRAVVDREKELIRDYLDNIHERLELHRIYEDRGPAAYATALRAFFVKSISSRVTN